MTATDGLPDGWEVVKEAPTAAEVIAHLDAHGVTEGIAPAAPWVQFYDHVTGWTPSRTPRGAWVDNAPEEWLNFRLIAPIVRPQVDPAAPSDVAQESQGATGAGGSAAPGPIDHTDPLPPCPTCGAQPGGCEHVTVHQRGESAKPGDVVLRRTVVTITYPWEDA